MSCRDWDERLNDRIDDLLDADGRRAVDEHVASCEGCRRALEDGRSLLRQAAELPGEEPPRDLWPAIRAALPARGAAIPTRERSAGARGWLLGLAAAAILVLGFTAGLLMRPGADRPPEGTVLASYRDAEVEYEQLSVELQKLLHERRDELSPETLALIEQNVGIIDQAIQEVRTALEADPASTVNGFRFTQLYGRKIALLRRAVLLPAKS